MSDERGNIGVVVVDVTTEPAKVESRCSLVEFLRANEEAGISVGWLATLLENGTNLFVGGASGTFMIILS